MFFAVNFDFDTSGAVADPAIEVHFARKVVDKRAEANPLHDAIDQDVDTAWRVDGLLLPG